MKVDEDEEFEETKAIRRHVLLWAAGVLAVLWLLSWPIPLLPRTLFWTVMATAALIYALISPHRPTSSSTRTMHPR